VGRAFGAKVTGVVAASDAKDDPHTSSEMPSRAELFIRPLQLTTGFVRKGIAVRLQKATVQELIF
jgi:hypothetical protein